MRQGRHFGGLAGPAAALALLLTPTPLGGAGPRTYRNEEFGIAARFPASLSVCEALSGGYHRIGFFAWIDRRTECGSPLPRSVSAINVTGIANAAFRRTVTLPGCRDGEVPRGIRIDLRGLGFRRLRSLRCATRQGDGSLHILVGAEGGRWTSRSADPAFGAPLHFYFARLITRPERLRRDMALFRSLLAHTRITPILRD